MKELNEGLNLNLAKQATKVQKNQKSDKALEDVFGVNVYRLYYDLDTGKQIFPTRKDPKLKFDIAVADELKNDVEERLEQFSFQVLDFDQNKAQNTRNQQITKISKVLAKLDIALLTKYTTYLENLTRKVDGKFYAVISRHIHDIAMMGSHYNFSTCENLEDVTDIKQTMLDPKNGESEDNFAGDGNGERAYHMMKEGHLIFYMVKEGDWNIKQPVARFAEGAYCTDNATIYGDYSAKFENFFRKWIKHFDLEVRKVPGLMANDQFFQQPLEKLVNAFDDLIIRTRPAVNGLKSSEFLRGLIKHKRFDVVERGLHGAHEDYSKHCVKAFCAVLVTISPKILDVFPSELKQLVLDKVNADVEQAYKYVYATKQRLDTALNNPDKLAKQFASIAHIFGKVDEFQILTLFGFDSHTLWDYNIQNHGSEVPPIEVAKAYGNEKANYIIHQVPILLQYTNGGKRKELISSLRDAVARLTDTQTSALSEQINRMKTMLNR